jgi:hypothetical protein
LPGTKPGISSCVPSLKLSSLTRRNKDNIAHPPKMIFLQKIATNNDIKKTNPVLN